MSVGKIPNFLAIVNLGFNICIALSIGLMAMGMFMRKLPNNSNGDGSGLK